MKKLFSVLAVLWVVIYFFKFYPDSNSPKNTIKNIKSNSVSKVKSLVRDKKTDSNQKNNFKETEKNNEIVSDLEDINNKNNSNDTDNLSYFDNMDRYVEYHLNLKNYMMCETPELLCTYAVSEDMVNLMNADNSDSTPPKIYLHKKKVPEEYLLSKYGYNWNLDPNWKIADPDRYKHMHGILQFNSNGEFVDLLHEFIKNNSESKITTCITIKDNCLSNQNSRTLTNEEINIIRKSDRYFYQANWNPDFDNVDFKVGILEEE